MGPYSACGGGRGADRGGERERVSILSYGGGTSNGAPGAVLIAGLDGAHPDGDAAEWSHQAGAGSPSICGHCDDVAGCNSRSTYGMKRDRDDGWRRSSESEADDRRMRFVYCSDAVAGRFAEMILRDGC